MAEMIVFMAKGVIVDKGEEKPFSKKVEAQNEKFAREKVLSVFGSKHGLKRRMVIIQSIAKAEAKAKIK